MYFENIMITGADHGKRQQEPGEIIHSKKVSLEK